MLAVVGEAVIDLIQDDDGRYTAHTGGSPLNVAVGLARLGEQVSLLARLSRSAFGRRLREHAEASGVDLARAVEAGEPASLAVVGLTPDGSAEYDFYVTGTADWQWAQGELEPLPAAAQVLHTGSLACFLPPGAARVEAAMRSARTAGLLVSFDPNVRPALLGPPEAAREHVERLITHCHVVKASEQDVAWLYPGESPGAVARRWLAAGPCLVLLTLGAAGALAVTRRVAIERPAPRVRVADTVGAGDAFTAGLLSSLVRRNLVEPDTLRAVAPEVLSSVLDDAITVAALTCTRPGADPPGRGDVDRFLGT
ncbi:carbohydrate kinase [Sphaerisporangium sp. NPDC049002]|uniref:carbohydrate kinase family protein n=1 Tax=unclassified Sphaerisporangium TaxID=2630420 RepID=UPI0033E44BCB